MSEEMYSSADAAVINMVNAHAEERKQERLEHMLEAKLRRVDDRRKAEAKRHRFLDMAIEAGSYSCLAVLTAVAAGQGLVQTVVGAPVVVACAVCAGIRIDRYLR